MMGLDHRHVLCLDMPFIRSTWLAGNHMWKEGQAMALADGIRRGCAVTKLYLTGNRLGPDGVISVKEAILKDELRRKKRHMESMTLKGSKSSF